MTIPYIRQLMMGVCLAAPLALAACGGPEAPPQSFPPLRFNYLAPISLNVANIETRVNYTPAADGSSVENFDPEPPLQAVQAMIQDRLVAAGGNGTAVVEINDASLRRVGDIVVGTITLHLTIRSADGRRSGYTDASVTRSRTTPEDTSDAAMRAFLYSMTQDLLNAENVQFEYQIRHNLGPWLVGGIGGPVGGPAAPVPVQAQDLNGAPSNATPVFPTAPTTGGYGAPVPLTPAMPQPGVLGTMPIGTTNVPPAANVPDNTPVPMAPMPGMSPSTPVIQPVTPAPDTTEMPSGSLGLPQGNPVPEPVAPAPTVVTPAPTLVAPVPAAPAAAPSNSSSTLPPLPAGITP